MGSGGNNANSGLSWALRKLTLAAAEALVAAGDTVYVGPGVYREFLECGTDGTAGNLISYIGDYSGANTDGVGGVVRICGSADDSGAPTRNNVILDGADYRKFSGIAFDQPSGYAMRVHDSDYTTVDRCTFAAMSPTSGLYVTGASTYLTVTNCFFSTAYGINFYDYGDAHDACGHVIQNCIFITPAYDRAFYSYKIGGIAIKNCLFYGGVYCVEADSLTAGQTITVTNSIFLGTYDALMVSKDGDITEDYNTFSGCTTPRLGGTPANWTGAHSLTVPALVDLRWFFELVNGGRLVTPFDLAAYSQLINVAGTSPTSTDMRGTGTVGAQREWARWSTIARCSTPRRRATL